MSKEQRTIGLAIHPARGTQRLVLKTAWKATIAPRRRGSVLVLVITILGLLFVVGAAFMASMNFESDLLRSQRLSDRSKPGMQAVSSNVESLLQELAVPGAGNLFSNAVLDSPTSYVELPGVHNLRAPLEPTNFGGVYAFSWMTDLRALTDPNFTATYDRRGSLARMGTDAAGNRFFRPINTLTPPGTVVDLGRKVEGPDTDGDGLPDPMPVFDTLLDADGDGIVDSVQEKLSELMDGEPSAVMEQLARAVNPVSNPDGKVFLGVRVIDHSAMVNLNASQPRMIETILGDVSKLDPPYSPLVEEASLRNRFFIPVKELPATLIQGNPMSSDPDAGEGHFSQAMFPPGQSLRDHRYWRFEPDETGADPDTPLWALRLDPEGFTADPQSDEYDRRHLVTTVSADDQLRRPTIVNLPQVRTFSDGSPPENVVTRVSLLTLMQEADRAACSAGMPLTFELPDYPFDLPNTFRGAVTDPKDLPDLRDYCTAVADGSQISLNPLKGRLKLSLPDLDKLDDAIPELLQKKIRLLQDYFAMLLLNARNDGNRPAVWGCWVPDPDPTKPEQWWDTGCLTDSNKDGFDNIAVTAASLAANFIDFYDADDRPTRVEVRSYNYQDRPNFGQPTGEVVYGIERQPYISEVVVEATEDPTSPGNYDTSQPYFFGVELFNPFDDRDMLLVKGDYEIRVLNSIRPVKSTFGTATIQRSRLGGNAFLGIKIDSGAVPGISVGSNTAQFTDLSFEIQPSSTIQLIRWVAGVAVVIDSFRPTEIKWDGVPYAFERGANSVTPWTVTVPGIVATPSIQFGDSPGGDSTGISPVRAAPANTGCAGDPTVCSEPAFPTTGSMLLLLRYANSPSTAFTTFLDDEQNVKGFYPIDNGHLPILDTDMNHHVPPEVDPSHLDPGSGLPVSTIDEPGDKMHLPWGQLVFDYFTAIPRDSVGPYKATDGPGVFDVNAKPKVDMAGLRVHGRINLNSAPWTVLQTLPVVRLNAIPQPFRSTIGRMLDPASTANPDEPQPIGVRLAKAIVAYREIDQLSDGPARTGDYRASGGRNYGDPLPAFRRGSGFMSVGELANVRSPDASDVSFRTDSGRDKPGDSFLESAALLIALDDWATVRSNVFTIYGTVRGEKDLTIIDTDPAVEDQMRQRDADARALRFQETVDRTPALIGGKPVLIGQRITGRYNSSQ